MPIQRIIFAVGCFHFSYKKKGPFEFTFVEYAKALEKRLSEIATISEVSMECDPELNESDTIEVEKEAPTLSEDNAFFPHLPFLELRFELRLPIHIQRKFNPGKYYDTIKTDHFRVFVENGFHCPVWFIQPIGADKDCNPSDVVPFIREYLRSEINTEGSDFLFEALGPSPFHANFELSNDPQATPSGFTCTTLAPRGYAQVAFEAKGFQEVEEAFELLRFQIRDEFSQFYETCRSESELLDRWVGVQNALSELIPSGTPSLKKRIALFFTRGRKIEQLHAQLASFEMTQMYNNQQVEQSYNYVHQTAEKSYLIEFADKRMKAREKYPTESIAGLIRFSEERRTKALELFVVLFAAVVGGIAGAYATNAMASLRSSQAGPVKEAITTVHAAPSQKAALVDSKQTVSETGAGDKNTP